MVWVRADPVPEMGVLEVPAVSPLGFILAMISLFGLAALVIWKVYE